MVGDPPKESIQLLCCMCYKFIPIADEEEFVNYSGPMTYKGDCKICGENRPEIVWGSSFDIEVISYL